MSLRGRALEVLEDWGAMTRRQVAREVGCSASTVASYLRGHVHVCGWVVEGGRMAAVVAAGPGEDVPLRDTRSVVREALSSGPATVATLAARTGLSMRTVRTHLTTLGASRVGMDGRASLWGLP